MLGTCCSLAHQMVVTGCHILCYRHFNLLAVKEILEVIDNCRTLLTCYRAREATQKRVEGCKFLAVVLVLLAQDMYLLELVNTLDKAFKTHA